MKPRKRKGAIFARKNSDEMAAFKIQIWTVFLIIVAMTPGVNSEPINPIKLSVLVVGTFASLLVLVRRSSFPFLLRENRWIILVLAFLIQLIVSGLANPVGLSKFIYGEWGRNTGLLFYISLILFFLVSFLTYDQGNTWKVYKCLLIAGMLHIIYMSLQTLNLDPVDWEIGQPFGFTGNLNFSSSLVSVYAIMATAWISQHNGRRLTNTILFLSVLIGFGIILNSGSVQGLIQFVIGMIIFWIFKSMPGFRRSYLIKFKVTLSIVVFWGAVFSIILTAIPNFLSGRFFQETMGYRRDYWLAGLEMIKSNLLLGIGVDNYGNFYHAFRQESAAKDNYLRQSNSAHSIILDIGANYGLIALLIYSSILVFMFYCLISTLRFKPENGLEIGLGSAWIALQIQNFIGINQATSGVLTWFIGGLFVAQHQTNRNERVLRPTEKTLTDSVAYNRGAPNNLLSPSGLVRAILGAFIGLIFVFPLLYGDISFQSARDKQDYRKMAKIAGNDLIGNQTMMEFLVSDLVGKSLATDGLGAARALVGEYPRSVYGWRVIASLKITPENERQLALKNFQELDPYGYKFATNPEGQ